MAKDKHTDRSQRLAEKLRENLRRRRALSRARDEHSNTSSGAPAPTKPSADPVQEED